MHLGRLPFLVVLNLSATLFGCGINGLTVEKSQALSPVTQQKPLMPLQIDVILVANDINDRNGQPLTFASVHWFWSQYAIPVQQLPNGFRFTSQFDTDSPSIEVSAFFTGLESCPIGIAASLLPIYLYVEGRPASVQRVLFIRTTAFSQTAGQIVTNAFDSSITTSQTVEACGTTFAVQFQITELSH